MPSDIIELYAIHAILSGEKLYEILKYSSRFREGAPMKYYKH